MLNIFKYYDDYKSLDKSELSEAISLMHNIFMIEDEPDAAEELAPVLHIIKRVPEYASEYARYIIKGRWKEAELVIMKDPYENYLYVKEAIKERCPDLEPIIIKDADLALTYAQNAIGGRWIEAEPIIMKHPSQAYMYAEYILAKDSKWPHKNGRWPEAEKYIMKSPEISYYYARDIIKGRWIAAEDVIRKDSYWWNGYKIKNGL